MLKKLVKHVLITYTQKVMNLVQCLLCILRNTIGHEKGLDLRFMANVCV